MEQILAEIRRQKLELSLAIGRGEVSDFASYRQAVGKIEGLTLAENIIQDALEQRAAD
jgi:hypothetical protein